jgi:hypothetical protein
MAVSRLSLLPACPSSHMVCVHPSCRPRPRVVPGSESRLALGTAPPFKGQAPFAPGALAPVRILLSRSINQHFAAPSAPLAGTPRFHPSGLRRSAFAARERHNRPGRKPRYRPPMGLARRAQGAPRSRWVGGVDLYGLKKIGRKMGPDPSSWRTRCPDTQWLPQW